MKPNLPPEGEDAGSIPTRLNQLFSMTGAGEKVLFAIYIAIPAKTYIFVRRIPSCINPILPSCVVLVLVAGATAATTVAEAAPDVGCSQRAQSRISFLLRSAALVVPSLLYFILPSL